MSDFESVISGFGSIVRHRWRFDSASPGTVTAQVAGPSQGGLSYAARFAGTGATGHVDQSTVLASGHFNGTTSGSVVVWFRTSATPAAGQSLISMHQPNALFLVDVRGSGSATPGAFEFYMVTNVNSGRHQFTNNGVDYRDGNWHLGVITCDGTHANLLYVDGQPVATAYLIELAGATDIPVNAWTSVLSDLGPFRFGNDAISALPLTGDMCQVAFIQGALTASQVSQLWSAAALYGGVRRGRARRTFTM